MLSVTGNRPLLVFISALMLALGQIWVLIWADRLIKNKSTSSKLFWSSLIPGIGQVLSGHRRWGLFLNLSLLLTVLVQVEFTVMTTPIYQWIQSAFSLNTSSAIPLMGAFDPYRMLVFGASAPIWLMLYIFSLWDCYRISSDTKPEVFSNLLVIIFSFVIPGFGNAFTQRKRSPWILLGMALTAGLLMTGDGRLGAYLLIPCGLVSGIWGLILIIISSDSRTRLQLAGLIGVLIVAGIAGSYYYDAREKNVKSPYFLVLDARGNVKNQLPAGGTIMCRTAEGGYAFLQQQYDNKSNHINLSVLDENHQLIFTKEVDNQESLGARALLPNKNGGFTVFLDYYSGSFSESMIEKIVVCSLDKTGNVLSRKSYTVYTSHEYSSSYNYATHAVWPEPDGGFLVVGRFYDVAADHKLVFYKISSDQKIALLNKTEIDYLGTDDPVFIKTKNSNILCGTSDVRMLRLFDTKGRLLWTKEYDDDTEFDVKSIMEMDDGGFIIAGHTYRDINHFDQLDIVVMKTDAAGNIRWRTRHNFEDNVSNSGYGRECSIARLDNGSYVLATHFGFIADSSLKEPNDLRILFLDQYGNKIRQKDLGKHGAGDTPHIDTAGGEIYVTGQ